MPRGYCRRHAGQGPCTCAMGNLYRFAEPLVLYLLESNGPTYGYELAGQMKDHALTDAEIDRGALYRTLQRLETTGHVTSDWDTTGAGPARHIYSLTDSGRQHLREWSVVLGNLARSMQGFVADINRLAQVSAAATDRD
jgi:PadR family transcriptional regulator, regulatory protein PadR